MINYKWEPVVRKISGHAAVSKEFYKYVAMAQSYQDMETEKMFEKMKMLTAKTQDDKTE